MSGTPRAGTPANPTGHVIRDSSLGLVPETLPALLDLQAAIWHRSSVGPALLELLRLRNARTVNCVFCKERALRHRACRWPDRSQGRADRRRLRDE
jgi:hypothetical protein